MADREVRQRGVEAGLGIIQSTAVMIPFPLKAKVANRGVPPDAFLESLIAWGRTASDDIFILNSRRDIYSLVAAKLGPFDSPLIRRAVMLEVLRVLGGFESSWRWREGKDRSNPAEDTIEEESAGVFQISADSIKLHASLTQLANARGVANAPRAFRELMISDPAFAFEYTARLLRVNLRHNGPVKRREILPWLSRSAVQAFATLITL